MSAKTQYQDVDDKIITSIRSGRTRFIEIHCNVNLPFRLVDRRLQSLRKRGLLIYSKKLGWRCK